MGEAKRRGTYEQRKAEAIAEQAEAAPAIQPRRTKLIGVMLGAALAMNTTLSCSKEIGKRK